MDYTRIHYLLHAGDNAPCVVLTFWYCPLIWIHLALTCSAFSSIRKTRELKQHAKDAGIFIFECFLMEPTHARKSWWLLKNTTQESTKGRRFPGQRWRAHVSGWPSQPRQMPRISTLSRKTAEQAWKPMKDKWKWERIYYQCHIRLSPAVFLLRLFVKGHFNCIQQIIWKTSKYLKVNVSTLSEHQRFIKQELKDGLINLTVFNNGFSLWTSHHKL